MRGELICDNQIIWLIKSTISSTSNKMKSMIKTSNLKYLFNFKFCLHRCDKSINWLMEIKTRILNSNWLQKHLFQTNWIQLNQRLKSDWLTRKTQKKKFHVVRFFLNFFCFFVKIWFLCYIATFAQKIFFENTEMICSNV